MPPGNRLRARESRCHRRWWIPGTGLVIPHRRERDQDARVEHVFARMKTWKIVRDCGLTGDGVHHAMLGIARLHNVVLTG